MLRSGEVPGTINDPCTRKVGTVAYDLSQHRALRELVYTHDSGPGTTRRRRRAQIRRLWLLHLSRPNPKRAVPTLHPCCLLVTADAFVRNVGELPVCALVLISGGSEYTYIRPDALTATVGAGP